MGTATKTKKTLSGTDFHTLLQISSIQNGQTFSIDEKTILIAELVAEIQTDEARALVPKARATEWKKFEKATKRTHTIDNNR